MATVSVTVLHPCHHQSRLTSQRRARTIRLHVWSGALCQPISFRRQRRQRHRPLRFDVGNIVSPKRPKQHGRSKAEVPARGTPDASWRQMAKKRSQQGSSINVILLGAVMLYIEKTSYTHPTLDA